MKSPFYQHYLKESFIQLVNKHSVKAKLIEGFDNRDDGLLTLFLIFDAPGNEFGVESNEVIRHYWELINFVDEQSTGFELMSMDPETGEVIPADDRYFVFDWRGELDTQTILTVDDKTFLEYIDLLIRENPNSSRFNIDVLKRTRVLNQFIDHKEMDIRSKGNNIFVRVFKSDLQISILDFVENATDSIGQNFRTGKPFDDVEYIVGLKAYSIWLEGYLKNKDKDYLEMSNVTARNAAIITIRALKSFPILFHFVENYNENFNYENEVKLATTNSRELFDKYREEWEFSISRSTILICRGLAYNYSGFENNLSGIINKVYPSYIEKAINEWIRNYN